MLNETEMKKHKALFLLFLLLVAFQLRSLWLLSPFVYAYDKNGSLKHRHGIFHSSAAFNTSIGFTVGVFFRRNASL